MKTKTERHQRTYRLTVRGLKDLRWIHRMLEDLRPDTETLTISESVEISMSGLRRLIKNGKLKIRDLDA